MKYLLVLCVLGLAAYGGYVFFHQHEPEVSKAADTAEKVGKVAEEATREIMQTSERVVNAAKAAEKEFNKK